MGLRLAGVIAAVAALLWLVWPSERGIDVLEPGSDLAVPVDIDGRGVLWLDEAPKQSVEIAADNARLRVLHDLGGGAGPPYDWIGGYVYLMEEVD